MTADHSSNLDAARHQLEQAQTAYVAAVHAYSEAVLANFGAIAADVLEDVDLEVFDLRTASADLQQRAARDYADRWVTP